MDRTDQFYASVGAWNREKEAFLATVTEGSSAGEKVFVENGTMQACDLRIRACGDCADPHGKASEF